MVLKLCVVVLLLGLVFGEDAKPEDHSNSQAHAIEKRSPIFSKIIEKNYQKHVIDCCKHCKTEARKYKQSSWNPWGPSSRAFFSDYSNDHDWYDVYETFSD